MRIIKNEIDFVYFKEVGPLDGEEINYVIIEHDNEYIVKKIDGKNPQVYKMANYIAYDYDKLSIYNQIRYEKSVHSLKKVDDNIYHKLDKKLAKKNNLFT